MVLKTILSKLTQNNISIYSSYILNYYLVQLFRPQTIQILFIESALVDINL